MTRGVQLQLVGHLYSVRQFCDAKMMTSLYVYVTRKKSDCLDRSTSVTPNIVRLQLTHVARSHGSLKWGQLPQICSVHSFKVFTEKYMYLLFFRPLENLDIKIDLNTLKMLLLLLLNVIHTEQVRKSLRKKMMPQMR